MKTIATVASALSIGLGLVGGAPAWAVGGSFHCERPSLLEVAEHVDGSFGLRKIVNQYMMRWDADQARAQCEAYIAGQPYEIQCMNGHRDWSAILSSVPQDYFGRSNQSLASVVRDEMRTGNGFAEAMDFCRSVGAIK